MTLRRVFHLLPLSFLLAASLRAQDLAYVENLAPDHMNIPFTDFNALAASFAARSASRTPLNLTGDGGTSGFTILSTVNAAGLNGAFYKTELAIQTMWLSSSIKVDIFAVPNSTKPLIDRSVIHGGVFTLKGFTLYTWDNILETLGLSGAGYVVVGIDSSTPNQNAYTMNAWANTYTAASPGPDPDAITGIFRTPLPVFLYLFGSNSYRHSNVTQNTQNRNNIVVFNMDTLKDLTVDIGFHPYTSSAWTTFTVTLAPLESRQYSFASIFPGATGQGELAFDYKSGGFWLGYVIRTDNGTNDGLLEIPYKYNPLSWRN